MKTTSKPLHKNGILLFQGVEWRLSSVELLERMEFHFFFFFLSGSVDENPHFTFFGVVLQKFTRFKSEVFILLHSERYCS